MVAAAAGARVAKHGGRAASSKCGSADVLEALGVVIDLGPAGVERSIREVGIGFCFAPRFHSGLRFAAPARRELGTPTTFNFAAPLANPAGVKRQIVGVSDPTMAERLIGMLAELGAERALVFYGHDGLDELTVTDKSTVHELRDGVISVYELDPLDFGIPRAEHSALAGGDAAGNADVVHKIFAGRDRPDPRHRRVELGRGTRRRRSRIRLRRGHQARERDPRRRARGRDPRRAGARHRCRTRVRGRLMAKALECPACGAKHRLDGLEPSTTFRCEQCGQTLKVPASLAAVRADANAAPNLASASPPRERDAERARRPSRHRRGGERRARPRRARSSV